MQCPECGEAIEPDWDECPACETLLPKFCPQCGREVKANWKKCPGCKTRLQGADTGPSSSESPAAPTSTETEPEPPSTPEGGRGGHSIEGDGVIIDRSQQHIYQTQRSCPICDRGVRPGEWFNCRDCKEKYICPDDWDTEARLCVPCAQKRRREQLARAGIVEEGMLIGDRYRIETLLGEGGMGRVFLATDLELGEKPFALKFLPQELSRDPAALQDLRREMQIAMQLNDDHIVRLFNFETVEGYRFLKMEYVDGPTLADLLFRKREQGATFTVDELLPLVRQICSALEYAHGRQVVHRDLKPGNVMVNSRGEAKLMDLGIARVVQDTMSRVSNRPRTGTLVYMSPEQHRGDRAIDGRSDLYSLGCTVYELLSGRPPFFEGNLAYQHLSQSPEPLRSVPAWVNEAVLRALAKDPDDRFGSAMEFYEELTGGPARKREAAREKEAAEARAREAAQRAAAEKAKAEEEARRAAKAKARKEAAQRAGEKAKREAAQRAAERARREAKEDARRKREPKVYTEWPFDAREAKRRQQETAEALGLPVETEVDLGKGAKMACVLIPAGKFLMGSPEAEEERSNNETQHRVSISKPFYVGKYQVTQTQWEAVTGENPSHFKGEQNPVEKVSWDDCQEFIKKLNARVGSARLSAFSGASEERAEARTTSLDFALPTEAQWEYACRAGTETPFHTGQTLSTDEANYDGNFPYRAGAKGESRKETISVGTLAGNAWGLYDMHGNVWGWCQDWYRNYPDGEVVDPTGPEEGSLRVRRGGSWGNDARDCRSACRHWHTPDYRNDNLGCRLLLRSNP